tara:strand:+ start:4726 stop:5196 length:471 start_codon:yes stop_codon:yes gene_type:complete
MTVVRLATVADVPAVVAIAREGINESGIPSRFDQKHATAFFKAYVKHKDFDLLVSVNGNEDVGGFAQVSQSTTMFAQPLCYLAEFWIRKADRRTWAARDLIEAVEQWAADRGCTAIYSTATSELSHKEQKLFENLLMNYGYRQLGTVYRLEADRHG